MSAYDNAIFQDHFNQEALSGKAWITDSDTLMAYTPHYDKHPPLDSAFCASIGREPDSATALHDEMVRIYLTGDYLKVLSSILHDTNHSNIRFLIGKCCFMLHEYETARKNFAEAIRLSHVSHDVYHRLASGEHYKRGKAFLLDENFDLAIADFTKALDLHPQNLLARQARAHAYKAKGNIRLSEEDELLLA